MRSLLLLGLAGLASVGARAEPAESLDAIVVTATRAAQVRDTSLRDVVVITRDEIAAAGTMSLAELLQRKAGVEIRLAGGPGQPAGLFMRGAGAQQTLVLVDGLRVGSATVGATAIEHLPLELLERIEVVKGPLSSLYGSDAIGGVVQVFTRGGTKPALFASLAGGSPGDYGASAGFTAVEGKTTVSLAAGARQVDAASATNDKSFCHDPDRDPYRNTYANLRATQQMWQGESLALYAFASQGKAHFDGCPDASGTPYDDTTTQTLSGWSLTSANAMAPGWGSRLTLGQGSDKLETTGSFASRFETLQNQLTWLNDIALPGGGITLGAETLRQKVQSSEAFTQASRTTNSAFATLRDLWHGQRLEASWRYDWDDQFGGRSTGAVSYGAPLPGWGDFALTWGTGFRAPTFFDLYGPSSAFYVPNPALKPERSKSFEARWHLPLVAGWDAKITWFDNRIEDLVQYVFPTVENVRTATIQGTQVEFRGELGGIALSGSATWQTPLDQDTGKLLQARARSFASLELSRAYGAWRFALWVNASSERFDSGNASEASRMAGYAVVNASVRYQLARDWTLELTGSNLGARQYELASGYNPPGRAVLLTARFEAR
jgi:vitamin B12 transporter